MAMRYELNGEALVYGPFNDAEGNLHLPYILDLWSDEDLAAIGVTRIEEPDPEPEPAPRRLVPKSSIQERVNAAGKWDAAMALLMPGGVPTINYARWFAPDWPQVYADDENMLAILTAAGCTPEEIAEITA